MMEVKILESGNIGITGTRQEVFNIAQDLQKSLFKHQNGITIEDKENKLRVLIHISNMHEISNNPQKRGKGNDDE